MKRKRSFLGLVFVFIAGIYIGSHVPSALMMDHQAPINTDNGLQPLKTSHTVNVETAPIEVTEPAARVTSPKKTEAAVDPNDPDEHIHIVFPSGCNAFQQWQVVPSARPLLRSSRCDFFLILCRRPKAELLLWSHWKTGQKGKITRIVHGCEDNSQIKDMKHLPHPGGDLDKNQEVSVLEASTHPKWTLYSTPGVEGVIPLFISHRSPLVVFSL